MNDKIYKDIPGIDCSDIAMDLYKANKNKGTIYHITPIVGMLKVYEYGYIEPYYYHDVYSYNNLIYDPRYSIVPVSKDGYFTLLRSINPNGINVWEIKIN